MSSSRAPVGHTCPNIDSLQEEVSQAVRDYHSFESEDDSARDAISNLLYLLGSVYDQLEDLRGSNSKLRDWGYDLVEHVKELEQKIDDLENENYELKDSIS